MTDVAAELYINPTSLADLELQQYECEEESTGIGGTKAPGHVG